MVSPFGIRCSCQSAVTASCAESWAEPTKASAATKVPPAKVRIKVSSIDALINFLRNRANESCRTNRRFRQIVNCLIQLQPTNASRDSKITPSCPLLRNRLSDAQQIHTGVLKFLVRILRINVERSGRLRLALVQPGLDVECRAACDLVHAAFAQSFGV